MTPFLNPSTSSLETRKRKHSESSVSQRAKTHGSHTVARDNNVDNDRNALAIPQTPAALAEHLAMPNSTSAWQENGSLFDRPYPLTAWKPCAKPVRAEQAPHQQRQTSGRFYNRDTSIGQSRQAFFDQRKAAMAKVILMMETTLGVEHYGDDRCHACVDRNIPCVRFIKGANRQILDCGSSCAWCRFVDVKIKKGCTKSDFSQARIGEEDADEEDENDSSTSESLVMPARSAVYDTRSKRQQAATQDTSETISRAGLSTSERRSDDWVTSPMRTFSSQRSSDHPILRFEALLGELDEDDANEAQQILNLIRRNLKKGNDASGLIDHLKSLFISVKQRVAGERHRLSNEMAQVAHEMQRIAEKRDGLSEDMAQVERKMQLFGDLDSNANDMDVDG